LNFFSKIKLKVNFPLLVFGIKNKVSVYLKCRGTKIDITKTKLKTTKVTTQIPLLVILITFLHSLHHRLDPRK